MATARDQAERRATAAAYVERFAELKDALPGAGVPWVAGLRERAIAALGESGFPTRRIEAYKYTNLAPLTRTPFDPAPRPRNGIDRRALAGCLLDEAASHRLVFVDGRCRPELSDLETLPEGVTVESLAEALEAGSEPLEPELGEQGVPEGRALRAFNTAFMADGAVLRLAEGVALEAPIHLVFVASGGEPQAAHALRNLIIAGAGSSVAVLESFVGTGAERYCTSAVTQVRVGQRAALRHYKLQAEGDEAIHLGATAVHLDEGSAYASFVMSLGARLSRNEIAGLLDGAGIDCRLQGAYLGRGRQHLDTSTWIDHAKAGSTSREVYKGVLDEAAHGVFQGRITVRQDAQHTDAHQLNQNLLLSPTAQVDTKPELEIFADDVKCSHGATAGELDTEAMFYLRSRGLDEVEARRLLIEAFVSDIVGEVETAAVRAHLERRVAAWLPRSGA